MNRRAPERRGAEGMSVGRRTRGVMRDHDLRCALHQALEVESERDTSTLIVDELGIEQGAYRVDVAVVNGRLHGYEIKSDRDTLARLPAQSRAYARVFDEVTIVVSPSHVSAARKVVPDWWSVVVCEQDGTLREVRAGGANPAVDVFALVQLLWRDEALEELELRGLATGLRSKTRRELWSALATSLAVDELRGVVRARLKNRRTWRADP